MMEVGVVGAAFIGVSSRSGPEVFSVPSLVVVFWDGVLGVDLDEVFWLFGILVKVADRFTSFSVFESDVIID